MITPNQRLSIIMLSAALLLMIPFVAMRFTGEVNWSTFDFAVAGILLFGTGLLAEFTLRVVKNNRYRLLLVTGLLVLLLLVWAELAVGVFGTPFAGS